MASDQIENEHGRDTYNAEDPIATVLLRKLSRMVVVSGFAYAVLVRVEH